MKNERSDRDYIDDILDSINSIEKFVANNSYEEFLNNEMLHEAVIRKIGIIGEACNKLSDITKNKYPEIPWREIIGMRNKIIHNYFGVNLYTVWIAVQDEIPLFKSFVAKLQSDFGNEE